MFNQNAPRYASYAVIDRVPGPIIDSIWYLIDNNLTGVVELNPLIEFYIIGQDDGSAAFLFTTQGDELKIKFDLKIPYDAAYPRKLMVYDDGVNQTVLLPGEIK